MSSATDLAWFARHEIRLAWREWLAMMTGGRRGRKRAALIGLIAFAAIMHLPAYVVIGRFADLEMPLDKSSLIVMTATIALAWALMLSQAIESVTRVFYARADLDLIMSSPVRLSNVFSVRIAAIALSVTAMALLLSTPFVDVLVIGGGIRWFSTFGVVIAIGLSAAAMAIAVTLLLFRLIGPSRTRLVARGGSRQQALRRKEFVLLRRDPWLLSQSLMQLLYLVPPALLLWRSFSDSSAAIVLVTPVIVMAAGQLAGGLAWLTISGEDAADLIATAPMSPSCVTRAKIEVVLIAIAVIFAPLVAALAFASPLQAAITALGVVVATVSATAIQLWFRVQAKRSQFRRRQTSSRLATFAEAFSSIGWAATAALALAMPAAALISGLMTAAIMAATWKISPRRD
jgi:MFS family permease